jgi:hypothetical protein
MSDLLEPCPVPEIFVYELAKIERMGPVSRLIFAVPQGTTFDTQQSVERFVVARLIVPTEAIPEIVAALRGDAQSLDRLASHAPARTMN